MCVVSVCIHVCVCLNVLAGEFVGVFVVGMFACVSMYVCVCVLFSVYVSVCL